MTERIKFDMKLTDNFKYFSQKYSNNIVYVFKEKKLPEGLVLEEGNFLFAIHAGTRHKSNYMGATIAGSDEALNENIYEMIYGSPKEDE